MQHSAHRTRLFASLQYRLTWIIFCMSLRGSLMLSPSPAAGAGDVPKPNLKKKKNDLPGEKLGFPMYHAVTGNLPVISQHLWNPPDGATAAVAAPPSDYEYITGNLPVISLELFKDDSDEMPPGWVQLVDPVTKRTFWWNIYYRSRRENRPGLNDGGHTGARRGEEYMYALHAEWARRVAEEQGEEAVEKLPPCLRRGPRSSGECDPENPKKQWVEYYDRRCLRPYYHNTSNNTTQWAKPSDFETNCEHYEPKWEERWDAIKEAPLWVCKATGQVANTCPQDFDNTPLIDCWNESKDDATGEVYYWNHVTDARQWEKPAGWPRPAPVDPPPSPPPSSMPTTAGAGNVASGDSDVIRRSHTSLSGVDLAAVSLAAMKIVGADVVHPDEEDDTIIFGNYRGYLKKKGGGKSLFGRRNWKERFCVISKGMLAYFDNQTEWEKGKEPLKGVHVTLRLYKVDPGKDSPTKFALVPLADSELVSSESFEEDGAVDAEAAKKKTKRTFEFEASSAEMKAKWIKVLRGRRADGRHRADSADFAEYYTQARMSVAPPKKA